MSSSLSKDYFSFFLQDSYRLIPFYAILLKYVGAFDGDVYYTLQIKFILHITNKYKLRNISKRDSFINSKFSKTYELYRHYFKNKNSSLFANVV